MTLDVVVDSFSNNRNLEHLLRPAISARLGKVTSEK